MSFLVSFTRAELANLWQHTEDLGTKIALILCYTGLSPVELALIKTADVDLTGRQYEGRNKNVGEKESPRTNSRKNFPTD